MGRTQFAAAKRRRAADPVPAYRIGYSAQQQGRPARRARPPELAERIDGARGIAYATGARDGVPRRGGRRRHPSGGLVTHSENGQLVAFTPR